MSETAFMTPWGYDIQGEEPLPELMSPAEFRTATAGKYDGDARINAALRAASAAIRDYCGWHLYPELPCRLATTFYDSRITRTGRELFIQLPARVLTGVQSVKINDTEAPHFTYQRNGLLHVYDIPVDITTRHDTIDIEYTAGLTEQAAAAIQDIAVARTTHGLNDRLGVQSEAAGGVSVTYNADWTRQGGAGALSPIDAQTLNTYRLQGVF